MSNNPEYKINGEGFLLDPADWTREYALTTAQDERIEMTNHHWAIIEFVRNYHAEYLLAPALRVLSTEAARLCEANLETGPGILERLFPGDAGRQVCKIAGLPSATGCV